MFKNSKKKKQIRYSCTDLKSECLSILLLLYILKTKELPFIYISIALIWYNKIKMFKTKIIPTYDYANTCLLHLAVIEVI